MSPLRIFIGYDAKEAVAYQVLTHSILRRATAPVTFCPIVRGHLGKIHTRERGPLDSTDFSITRFLVPWLSDYEGVSIFMDCDFLCLANIYTILAGTDQGKAVWVCKHDYVPKGARKFGQTQTSYRRKNWSSLMVFDNAKCASLTPEYVNEASGLDLHQFAWLQDEEIGTLPLEWNWLVGEYPPNSEAKMLHYTLGGPWFKDGDSGGDGYRWTREFHEMTGTQTPHELGLEPVAPSIMRRR